MGIHTSGAAQAKVPKAASLAAPRWSPAPACIICDSPTSLIFASPSCSNPHAQLRHLYMLWLLRRTAHDAEQGKHRPTHDGELHI